MSALIRSLVLKKRAAAAERAAFAARSEHIIAAARGEKGPQGTPGPIGPMPDHQWQGTKLRFQKPDGAWGKYTDLKGQPGKDGRNGISTAGTAFDPATLQALSGAPGINDYLILERGGTPYRVSLAQLQALFGSTGLPTGAVTVNGEAVMAGGENVIVI